MSVNGDPVTRNDILPLMGPGKKVGEWFMAYCPTHPDGQKHKGKGGQSLGLSDGGMLRCFAGCDFKEVMAALRAGAGERGRRAPDRPHNGAPEVETARYVYRHQSGLGVEKVRYERDVGGVKPEKRFQWPPGTKMAEMGLYRLEELEAADPARAVWFTEGEKDADALCARNELATTAAGGASQRDFGAALEVLRGRVVVVWPDNDEPGRTYRDVLRAALEGVGAMVRIFQPGNMPPGGGAHDYFTAGRSLEEFTLARKVEVNALPRDGIEVVIPVDGQFPVSFAFHPYARSRGAFDVELTIKVVSPFPKAPQRIRINVLSHSALRDLRLLCEQRWSKEFRWPDVIAEAVELFQAHYEREQQALVTDLAISDDHPRPDYLLGRYVAKGRGTFLYGPPGAGKSTTAMLWAISIDAACDTIWPVEWARVLYVNLERSAADASYLFSRCARVLGVPGNYQLAVINRRGATFADVLEPIREAIWQRGIEVVVYDSVSRAGYGNLNDNDTGNRVADALNGLGVAWVGVAHSPRGDDSHIYGSVMFDAAADVMVQTTAEQESETTRGVQLTITKHNHAGLPRPEQWAYEYDEDGLLNVTRSEAGRFSELDARRRSNLADQVAEWLMLNGSSDASTIADQIGARRDSVQRLLAHSPRFLRLERDGHRQLYGVAAHVEEG